MPFAVAVVSAVGVGVGLYRRVTNLNLGLPRSERLGVLASRLERRSSLARSLGVSEHVTPTREQRVQREVDALKERYVQGDLSEREFERRLETVTGGGPTGDGGEDGLGETGSGSRRGVTESPGYSTERAESEDLS